MRHLIKKLIAPLRHISPEVKDHVEHLLIETEVALRHGCGVRGARRYKGRSGLKINFGSGSKTKEGFVNVDLSPHADLRVDLRRPIPLEDNTCALLFTEHFVEHLSYPEGAEMFFRECYRVIEPGGQLKVSVPDTEWPLREYGTGQRDYLETCDQRNFHPPECETEMEHINYHFRQRKRGQSYSGFERHRFAYDFETMAKVIRAGGFETVDRRSFEPELDSEHREIGSLFVVAVKAK